MYVLYFPTLTNLTILKDKKNVWFLYDESQQNYQTSEYIVTHIWVFY